MPITIDHQLREQMSHDATVFPITYFDGEFAMLPNWTGPLHWHPEFEIAMAESNILDFQVGQKHLALEPGDSVFVNGNILHGIRQLSGDIPDPMPNIVFSGGVVAPETSVIYQKYIRPIADGDSLPFIVFRQGNDWHNEVNHLVEDTYHQSEATRIQINTQVRIQQMLEYIYTHYAESVTLDDIAGAASISRSEAGRCFNAYLGCSPVDALIQYRLQTAYRLLSDTTLTLQEISHVCGFNSVNYFSRQFRKTYGYAPGKNRTLGK